MTASPGQLCGGTPTDIFGRSYAEAYDTVYADKDYLAEAARVARLVRRHRPDAASVLDLGCGTGRHARCLKELGFAVTGVDRSESMLQLARERLGGSVELRQGDITTLQLGASFDAAVMLFNVLGYAAYPAGLETVLRSVRRHLRPGGVLITDGWWAPAVRTQRPRESWRVLRHEQGHVIRLARGRLSGDGSLCTVSTELWDAPTDRPATRTVEEHIMRIFDGEELIGGLARTDFEVAALEALEHEGRAPSAEDWSFLLVAVARP